MATIHKLGALYYSVFVTIVIPEMSSSVAPLDDDWQSHKSVLASNRYMLENQIECDVFFTLLPPGGETVNVGSHKYALISRSPVFFAMLSGPMADKKKEIKITDISPVTFWQLLRYCMFIRDAVQVIQNAHEMRYSFLVTEISPLLGSFSQWLVPFCKGGFINFQFVGRGNFT